MDISARHPATAKRDAVTLTVVDAMGEINTLGRQRCCGREGATRKMPHVWEDRITVYRISGGAATLPGAVSRMAGSCNDENA